MIQSCSCSVWSRLRSLRASGGGVCRRGRSGRRSCRGRLGAAACEQRCRRSSIANGQINGRAFGVLAQRMALAAFHAAPAKRALAGIVAPGEVALAALEFDGARGAAHLADGAAGAERGIEAHQAPVIPRSPWGARERAWSASRPTGSSTAWSRMFMTEPHEERGRNGQDREDKRALPVKAHRGIDRQARRGRRNHRQQQHDGEGEGNEDQDGEPPRVAT